MKELVEDPQSTWGASEEYKAAWFDKYGEKLRKAAEKEQKEKEKAAEL